MALRLAFHAQAGPLRDPNPIAHDPNALTKLDRKSGNNVLLSDTQGVKVGCVQDEAENKYAWKAQTVITCTKPLLESVVTTVVRLKIMC